MAQIAYMVDGKTYTAAEMRAANADDVDFLAWMDAARVGDRYPADPARNMRAELKRAFPGVRFSVRRDRGSIRVGWTDGPTAAAVEAIADRFEHGKFDGMTDCYNYSRAPWSETFGGVDYVFCNRDHSDAHVSRAIAAAVEQFGAHDAPTLEEFRAGKAWQTYPGDSFAGSDHWSWQSIVHRAAAELAG